MYYVSTYLPGTTTSIYDVNIGQVYYLIISPANSKHQELSDAIPA